MLRPRLVPSSLYQPTHQRPVYQSLYYMVVLYGGPLLCGFNMAI